MSEATLTLTLEDRDEALQLFGSRDQHLRMIRDSLGVRLIARGDTMQIEGSEEQVNRADRVFQQLRQMLRKQGKISGDEVRTVLDVIQHGDDLSGPDTLALAEIGRHVRPRTDGQARYVRAMRESDLTFCI